MLGAPQLEVLSCHEQRVPAQPGQWRSGGSPKASQREAGLVGGKVSVVLTGTLMKCLQLPKSEKGSSFSIAFYLVGFGLFPQRLLLHTEVKESYLASCRSRCSHLICWKPKGVSVYIS